MTEIFDYQVPLSPYVAIPLFVLAQAGLIWIVDTVFKRYLNAWAESTETVWDDVVVHLARGVLLTAMLLSIPYVAVKAFVPDEWVELKHWLDVGLFGLLVGGVVVVHLKTLAMAARLIQEKSSRAATWLGFARGAAGLGLVVCGTMIVWDYATEKPEVTVFLGRKFPLSPWILVPILVAVQSVLVMIVNHVFDRYLKAWAESTETDWDDLVVWAAQRSVLVLLLLSIPFLVLNSYEFLAGKPQTFGNNAIIIAAIVSLTFIVYRTISQALAKVLSKKEDGAALAAPVQTVMKIFFAVIGVMIVLDTLGVSITPILTTLGVGSVAIALALQDTLSNLFAGFYMMADRPVRVGDFIQLEGGADGTVEKIGWRTTRLRTRRGNVVIIPNNKMSQSTITNYDMPDKPMRVLLKVGASYDDDPAQVMKVLDDVLATAVKEVPELVAEPPPSVSFLPGFGESSIDFTIMVTVKDFGSQFSALGELNRRIFERFKAEGISIPYPHRTVYMRNETDWNVKKNGDGAGG